MKKQFIIQPFYIGPKRYKSLGIIVPSKIVKEYKIDPSTGFILKHNSSEIKLKIIKENEKTIPVDSDSFAAKDQQVSIIKGVD